jgi:hypothetical protein
MYSLEIKMGNGGKPIIAMLPMIRHQEASGCNLKAFLIS